LTRVNPPPAPADDPKAIAQVPPRAYRKLFAPSNLEIWTTWLRISNAIAHSSSTDYS